MGCTSSKSSKAIAVGKATASESEGVTTAPKAVAIAEGTSESKVDDPIALSQSPIAFSQAPPLPVSPQAQSQAPALPAGPQAQSQPSLVSNKTTATLKKARTTRVDKTEVDFMVLKFVSHDAGVYSHLGQGAKESTWLVQAGREGKPIEIKMHVDRTILTTPEVGIQCDGQYLCPKAKIREDFVHRWPFRGVATGIGQRDIVEIRPAAFGNEQWHPATLTKQRDDGLFEALVWMDDGCGSCKEYAFQAVPASNIRYRSTGRPFFVPQRTLKLEVPAKDPAHATLTVDSELMTHFFARPTPTPQFGPRMEVLMKVSKDRRTVTSNVGHQVFSHHISNEVRLVTHSGEKRRRSWTIQIGPFAEHTIDLETHWNSRVVTLTIDGEKLVEASAEDIDSRDHWECKFRFMGERYIHYKVHETNQDGVALDTQAIVSQHLKYSRDCAISVVDESNLSSADLVIDGVSSDRLPFKRDVHEENELNMNLFALHTTYGLTCPYKVNEQAPCGLSQYADALSEGLAGFRNIVVRDGDALPAQEENLFGRLFKCCKQPSSAGGGYVEKHDVH